jgi:phosphohistidine phosphatase
MPVLILMRHAHAELPAPGMRDFDRPLSRQGCLDAKQAGELFVSTGLKIDKVFCSPAKRTEETLSCLREVVPIEESIISRHNELYSGEVAHYAEVLQQLQGDETALIVGHNPMTEHFAVGLTTSNIEANLKQLKYGFPTAAIAVISCDLDVNRAEPHGTLLHFLTVK